MSGKADKEPKMSWKEAMGLNMRVYKMWWQRHPRHIMSTGLLAVVEGLSPYAGIFLVAQIINELAGARDLNRLIFLAAILIGATAVLSMLDAFLRRWRDCHDGTVFWFRVDDLFKDKLLSMDFVDVEKSYAKELLAKIEQAQNWNSFGIIRSIWRLGRIIQSVMSIFGAIALTVTLFTLPVPEGAGRLTILNNPVFMVALIALILGVAIISPALSNKAQSYWGRNSDKAKLGNRFFSYCRTLSNEKERQLDVRIYEQEKLEKKIRDISSQGGPLDFFTGEAARYGKGPVGMLTAASSAVSHVLTAIIYIFVCLKAWAGAFAVGNITQYIRAITNFSRGISDLLETMGILRTNGKFLKDVFELLDMPNKMYMGSLTTEKRSDHKLELEFRNVSFKYPGNEEQDWVLRNVSIKFAVGQRLAIVGENGSGKTTFIKLLCRLYDPTEGEILLNGIDIRKYNYRQYMDCFSVVFQDFQLLAQSLGANVAASPRLDEAKVRECLIKSGFEQRLEEMPKGLNTCLYKEFEEDGVSVSGGEAQKIALARALYKDAPFVILDEPTAALDPIAEFEIYSKMNDIVGSKTAIFISHRLSSCRFCANIAVFDNGKIVQYGGHEGLVADEKGKYHELWHAQAQYYSEETT